MIRDAINLAATMLVLAAVIAGAYRCIDTTFVVVKQDNNDMRKALFVP